MTETLKHSFTRRMELYNGQPSGEVKQKDFYVQAYVDNGLVLVAGCFRITYAGSMYWGMVWTV